MLFEDLFGYLQTQDNSITTNCTGISKYQVIAWQEIVHKTRKKLIENISHQILLLNLNNWLF